MVRHKGTGKWASGQGRKRKEDTDNVDLARAWLNKTHAKLAAKWRGDEYELVGFDLVEAED